ncbi:ABC transporter ATP-binding protein [Paenibacillus sp. OAS669]|uniref:ABC transporter ATP-binding protein n=1 Tax=Paenibacillus sp. OAS669 TaxID=2663821 RepID=UPI001789E26C|nr:ABC transporter ATP-binding protein [Paenibacillus sp. OAS669]MBE1446665.1 putative ABC transport system ATP-binding protein [Paenibacillus sp. OAS669]
MITLTNVRKSFLLDGVESPILHIPHWFVDKGQRIALIGPSGSGKSTLLHLLGGVLAPDSGEMTIANHPLHRYSEAQRDQYRAKQVGYIFQDFHLISSLTAKQNVELVLPREWSKQERESQVNDWFERVGLSHRKQHLPSQLSRGQQQRVAIIRALIHRPPFILADEPTGSLDWEAAGSIMQLLLSLCEEEGSTLVTVTHDLHLAELYPVQVHMGEINMLLRPGQGRPFNGEGGEPIESASLAMA